MRKLSIDGALYAISRASEFLDYPEPLPKPSDNHIRNLVRCIEQPFTTYSGKYLYWNIWHRAAVLFYLIIKNHPLENGNKRSAVVLTMLFLYMNGKALNMSPDDLYDIACEVAESEASRSEDVILLLKNYFKKMLHDI